MTAHHSVSKVLETIMLLKCPRLQLTESGGIKGFCAIVIKLEAKCLGQSSGLEGGNYGCDSLAELSFTD